MLQRLVAGDAVVEAPERRGEAAAGRGERLEAERLEQARRADVPRVRQQERRPVAVVELEEVGHGSGPSRIGRLWGSVRRHALPGQRSQARARAPREATPRTAHRTAHGAGVLTLGGVGRAAQHRPVQRATRKVAIGDRSRHIDESALRRRRGARPISTIAAPSALAGATGAPPSTARRPAANEADRWWRPPWRPPCARRGSATVRVQYPWQNTTSCSSMIDVDTRPTERKGSGVMRSLSKSRWYQAASVAVVFDVSPS